MTHLSVHGRVTKKLERPTWRHPLLRFRWVRRHGRKCRIVIEGVEVEGIEYRG